MAEPSGQADRADPQLGLKEGPWEIELKIPQKHIGQVLNGFQMLKKRLSGRRFPAAQRSDEDLQG